MWIWILGFRRNRTDDLEITSPSLWPTEPRLHVRYLFLYLSLAPPVPIPPPPHLHDGHKDIVGCSAIPACLCPGPVQYPWGSIIESEVLSDETPGLMTLQPHNTNVSQTITIPTWHIQYGTKKLMLSTRAWVWLVLWGLRRLSDR